MKIFIDTKDAEKQLRSHFWGLSKSEQDKAIARGMNDAIKQSRTVAKRSIMEQYNMKAKHVASKLLPIKRATPSNLEATLSASANPVPVSDFKGLSQTEEGVSVSIKKGQRSLVRGAFMTEATGKAVLARNWSKGKKKYQNGKFAFRNKRLEKKGPDMPIASYLTVSPLKAGLAAAATEAVQKKYIEAFQRRALHHLQRALNK